MNMNNLTFEQLELQLTETQRKAAWLLANGNLETIGKKKTPEETATELGIDPEKIYNWQKNDDFIAYFNAISHQSIDSF